MKKITAGIAVLLIIVMFSGCGATVPAAETSGEEIVAENAAAETTAPVEPTEETAYVPELYQEELLDYSTEKWEEPDDSWKKGEKADLANITTDMRSHGFREIYFDRTFNDPASYGACEITDVQYYFKGNRAHMMLTFTTHIGTPEEVSEQWEIHAERTDEKRDISGVGNPHPMCVYPEFELYDGAMNTGYCSYEGTVVDLYYYPKSGNMYSIHITERQGPSPRFLEDLLYRYQAGS